jgi:hypothetical protein
MRNSRVTNNSGKVTAKYRATFEIVLLESLKIVELKSD